MQRSSLGVAAVEATQRFEVAASVLSMLSVAQIVVYAALQIPVGVLIDRFGPRLPLVAGAALMALGQVLVGVSQDFGLAVVGRVLVGAGDAMTFIAGIRMVAMWFEPRRVPILSQVFAQIGQIGQILSAFPFLLLLHGPGWLPAFLSAAALSVLGGLAVLVATASAGEAPHPFQPHRLGLAQTISHVLEALRRPGTQIGFWTHFTLQPSLTMFMLLWGFPYLTVAAGLSPALATLLFTGVVVWSAIVGPALGILSARFPFRRSNISLAIVGAIVLVWIVVLCWPGPPPLWLLIVLLAAMTVGGPGSMIGFDYARTYNPARSQGSANGVVNVGGFLASFVIMFGVGVLLDLLRDRSGGDPLTALYALDSFRIAFIAQFPVILVGVWQILRLRRRMRRTLREEEGITVAPLWVAAARAWKRRSAEHSARPERSIH
ncbi:MAG: MFS transporter [Microbacteriaceae bacterium]|nr:MFS transporter [Microbacteriaceae bacterium]